MKQIVIIKLDTPLTLEESAAHVPQAEPMVFAKALINACKDETLDVCLLGLSAKESRYKGSKIRILPFFGSELKVLKQIDDDAKIIVWQGRQCFYSHLAETATGESRFVLSNPVDANWFERLSMVELWQVLCYNLLANTRFEKFKIDYIVTDTRLPLADLNKIDSQAVPVALPKSIRLVTQANQAEAYMAWHNKFGNDIPYPELKLGEYCYQFKDAIYLPLHLLPLTCHSQHHIAYTKKSKGVICQIQTFRYLDDYRRRMLGEFVNKLQGKVTIMGRNNAYDKNLMLALYTEYADELQKHFVSGKDDYALPYFKAAKMLADYRDSIVITDRNYARFGLVPNRIAEAIAVGSLPLIPENVTAYASNTSKHITEVCNNLEKDGIDCKAIEESLASLKSKLQSELDEALNHYIYS